MLFKLGIATLATVVLNLSASAVAASSKSDNKLVLTGSSTVAPLIMEMAKRFESQNAGVRIDVQTGGSSRGVADARQDLADIGMVSRKLKADEADLKAFAIALDGISIILHSSNPVKSLDNEQIKAVYTGKIKNWKEVGGKDATITVVSKAEGRSTLELFLEHFKLKNSELKPQIIIGDNVQGIKSVSGNVNSIGYVSIGAAEAEARAGAKVKLLPIGGIEATISSVRSGAFPIARPLNLIIKGEATGLKKAFLEFAQSKKVTDLVEGQYFVPLAN